MKTPVFVMSLAVFAGLAELAGLAGLARSVAAAEATHDDAAQRARIVATAREYVTHPWRATKANVFHGNDANGVRIDTAEAKGVGFRTDGSVNVGVPYQWGGFSSLAEFDAGVAAGRPAGHLIEDVTNPGSHEPVGVDCSGLVSRCWNLPLHFSTGLLPGICRRLPAFADLEPGDVLNTMNGHVMLFVAFEDAERTELRIIEAARPKVRERVVTVAEVEHDGFEPLRYGPFSPDWPKPPVIAAAFRSEGNGTYVPILDLDYTVTEDLDEVQLTYAHDPPPSPGTYVRYRLEPAVDGRATDWTLTVTGSDETHVRMISALGAADERVEHELTIPLHWSKKHVLEAALSATLPFKINDGHVRAGSCGRCSSGPKANSPLGVAREHGELTGAFETGRTKIPAVVTFTTITSDDVPLTQMISLDVNAVLLGQTHDSQHLDLVEFGRAKE